MKKKDEEKKKREALQKRMKKEVDRKASKNRKIRYIVHDKITNFMAPDTPENQVEQPRESILAFMFGQKTHFSTEEQHVRVKRKTKDAKAEADVALI